MKHPQMVRILKWSANLMTPAHHDYSKWERKNKILRFAGVHIGKRVAIGAGFDFLPGQEGNIYIDDNCAIGNDVNIWGFNEVRIGSFSMLAADITLSNGWHDKHSLEPHSGPLVVGRGCWIGTGAKIVGSLTIGENAIVGAGAVVVRDVPAGSIVAGIPARVIGWRELPDMVWHIGNEYFSPFTFDRVE